MEKNPEKMPFKLKICFTINDSLLSALLNTALSVHAKR